jgi:hypothetical protein
MDQIYRHLLYRPGVFKPDGISMPGRSLRCNIIEEGAECRVAKTGAILIKRRTFFDKRLYRRENR